MLNTQFSKAIYLCLFCCITSSFVTAPHVASSTLPEERFHTNTMSVDVMESGRIYLAPVVKLNRQALQFANHYIRTSAEDLVSVRQRSKIPFTIMDSVFTRHKLPVELKYLAVIESELKTSALSRVGALGPWQLMPGTAHDLGLKITRNYDERTSYYKSTKAAALYLKDLYKEFGDWLLVLAAYNAGPRPVYTAIHKAGSRNFWALQNYLPAETRGHVKRFIATHYYFEGKGSVTTLTKAENIEFAKTLRAFAVAHPAVLPNQQGATLAIGTIASSLIGMTYVIPAKNETTNKENASQEVRFGGSMKESEKVFRKANKIMEGMADQRFKSPRIRVRAKAPSFSAFA